MTDAILLELASRWEEEAETPHITDPALIDPGCKATRETLRSCADCLRMLIHVLGDSQDNRTVQDNNEKHCPAP